MTKRKLDMLDPLNTDVPPDVLHEFEASLDADAQAYEQALVESLTSPRTAVAAPHPLHVVADTHQPKLEVALRYAFAVGRRKLPKRPMTTADQAEPAVKAMMAALKDVLPSSLTKVISDGAQATTIPARVRAAGGSGSGNFGHAGRPGEVGGSGWTTDTGNTLVKALGPGYQIVGSVAKSGSSAHDLDILRDGVHTFSGTNVDSHVKRTLEALGFEYTGQSVLSPEDKAADKKGKVFGTGWSEIHHFEHSVTHAKIEVWTALKDVRAVEDFRTLKKTKPLTMKFDATNPKVVEAAQQQAAKLVTDVSKSTRQAIKNAVVKHVSGDLNDRDYFDEINTAIGDPARAQLIARTETMRAVNTGQRFVFDDARDDGLIPEDAELEWIATEDKVTCPICADLDGERIGFDEGFDVDGDILDHPPAHPNCRCTVGLVY